MVVQRWFWLIGSSVVVFMGIVLLDQSTGQAGSVFSPTESPSVSTTATSLPWNLDEVVVVEDDTQYTIRQLLPKDSIAPIYNPQYITASQSTLSEDELVLGLEIDGDARAYPIAIMRFREIVNDEIGGTPVLVTW